FDELLPDQSPYEVTVISQPSDRSCGVEKGKGIVDGRAIETVRVECWPVGADLTLRAETGIGKITLRWNTGMSASVLRSTDPECDWNNVLACENGSVTTNAGSPFKLNNQDGLEF